MGINEILATTTLLAGATLDDVLDDEGRFDIEKARETGGIHALKKVKTRTWSRQFPNGTVEQVVTHEVELRDKNGSLELMGRHFQLWNDGEDPDAEAKRLLELEMETEGRKRLADSSAIIESPVGDSLARMAPLKIVARKTGSQSDLKAEVEFKAETTNALLPVKPDPIE